MIKEIMRDVTFLSLPSEKATRNDINVGQDLLDTLTANKSRCVGMAVNMIGVRKRIIIVDIGFSYVVMYNPKIINKRSAYQCFEGCLSLDGERETTRFEFIEVEYFDSNWNKQRNKFSGFIAQIIQHEIDHCNGIII